MSQLGRGLITAVTMWLVSGACRDERPTVRAATTAANDVVTRREADDVAGPTEVVDASVAEVDAPEARRDTTPQDTGPPLTDLCKAACDNALRVTLAELPAETTGGMRGEITRALETTCPERCTARGSPMSVRCVAEAKTALELAACPR